MFPQAISGPVYGLYKAIPGKSGREKITFLALHTIPFGVAGYVFRERMIAGFPKWEFAAMGIGLVSKGKSFFISRASFSLLVGSHIKQSIHYVENSKQPLLR